MINFRDDRLKLIKISPKLSCSLIGSMSRAQFKDWPAAASAFRIIYWSSAFAINLVYNDHNGSWIGHKWLVNGSYENAESGRPKNTRQPKLKGWKATHSSLRVIRVWSSTGRFCLWRVGDSAEQRPTNRKSRRDSSWDCQEFSSFELAPQTSWW